MTPFTFNTIKSLIFEAGAAARLAEVAGQTLGTSVFLVTDPSLRQLGLADPTIASLKEAGHSVAVFDKVEADPSCETLMDAVVSGREADATGVVGFGGGSSPDVAKLVAILQGSSEDLDEAWGVGQAFANSSVAAVHALAYPIGGTFHVPHGLSNALVLPHVLRFIALHAHGLNSEIAVNAFPQMAQIEGSQARCAAFIDALADLSAYLGMQTWLRGVDIPQDALAKMASDAMVQQRLLVNNPRVVTENDALNIYKVAW